MNPSGLTGLLKPHAGRSRQATSNDRDLLRGSEIAGLRPAAAFQKRILLEPGEEHVMADLPGPGLVTRLWMTALPLTPRVLRGLTLRFYWDHEPEPSVAAPFGDFFGAPFGRYVPYLSQPLGLTGGGFISYWPMPFSNARLVVTNESQQVVDPFYYQVGYTELETPATDLRFHARWRRESFTTPGRAYTLLDARGPGHYVGCHLYLQNREWWLRPPWRRVVFPRAFGLGMLEGRTAIFIDDEDQPSIRGTGIEDDFGAGLYFLPGGRFSGPYHGCTLRDYWRGRFAMYRFDVNNPIPFDRSIQITIDHGIHNERPADYASVAYWYQEEPHTDTRQLRQVSRTVSPARKNQMQIILILGFPFWLIGGLLTGLRILWKKD